MNLMSLAEAVRSLYGGLKPLDVLSAFEDGVVSAEEKDELAALVREENYKRHLAGSRDRWQARACAKREARVRAFEVPVAAGMVLRGNKWVQLAV